MSEATGSLRGQIFVMLVLGLLFIGWLGYDSLVKPYNQSVELNKLKMACAVTCNSTDIVIQDGKCGCITWRTK